MKRDSSLGLLSKTRSTASGRLDEAIAYLERSYELLGLRHAVSRNIRAAIKCLLEAEAALDAEGPGPTVDLELVCASLWAGAAEQAIKKAVEFHGTEDAEQANRRAFPRLRVSHPIELEPDLLLSDRKVLQVPINGATVNISRGGILARVDQGILESGRYLVRFPVLKGGEGRWGTVRRSRSLDSSWEVGIEFANPLADLGELGLEGRHP